MLETCVGLRYFVFRTNKVTIASFRRIRGEDTFGEYGWSCLIQDESTNGEPLTLVESLTNSGRDTREYYRIVCNAALGASFGLR